MVNRRFLLKQQALKVNRRLRRLLQTFFVVLLVAISMLLAYLSLSRDVLKSEPLPTEELVGKDYNYLEEMDDVFISVKTTRHYHKGRLPIILATWFQLAKEQTWFFTDIYDEEFQLKTHGHMINTNCSSFHDHKGLCCKMSAEFDAFINTNKKWFCHFDDDNYVNVPRLMHFLSNYSAREDWYLGKPSVLSPWEIIGKDNQKVIFSFATGGAGFCLSRALTLKMIPVAGGGKFISVGEKIGLADDMTMGYIIGRLVMTPLTAVDQFHSHLESLRIIRRERFSDQITFSYSPQDNYWNTVKIEGFHATYDPSRFLSLHCFLFPYFKFCPR
ncbi:hypothetical protein ILUMI_23560 [Ignelater luminosus]|uniref:Fringe-like glycosyltransferase domain-containing protein n=1 Tax=Ignelater luminosus TaxID=2038154 RepID=A0A8K0G1S7_IGNLU|nr:hypothetical protein ILUMI_23560 [Ignelater luminosus]